jgi:hypothetical protein
MNYHIGISLHEKGFYSWQTQTLALFKENNLISNDFLIRNLFENS